MPGAAVGWGERPLRVKISVPEPGDGHRPPGEAARPEAGRSGRKGNGRMPGAAVDGGKRPLFVYWAQTAGF